MKIPFHGIRAAELWNSFAVGGSGGKAGKSCEAEPITPSLPEGMGTAAADGPHGSVALPSWVFRTSGWREGGRRGSRSKRCPPQS